MSPRLLALLAAFLCLAPFAQADTDEELAAALKALSGGKDAEKLKALKDIAALGKEGKPAARAVAGVLFSSNKDIQKQAIDTFGTLEPEMLKPVLRLVLEREVARTDYEAVTKFNNKAAIPLIRGRINRDVKAKNLVGINEGILALTEIGTGDEEATDALIRLATYRLEGISRDYRDLAVGGLSIHASVLKGELRDRVVIALDRILVTQMKPMPKPKPKPKTKDKDKDKDKDKENETVLTIATIRALGRYGKEAARAVPTLKTLRLDKDNAVRDAAIDALKAIEGE
jgi:hypothetical protein